MNKNHNFADGEYGHDSQDENLFNFDRPSPFSVVRYPPELINSMHETSDVDVSTLSFHHTLGAKPNQASPGNHTHDGGSSKSLFKTFSGNGVTSSGGLLVIATGATFPIKSGHVMYDQTGRSFGPWCSALFYDVAAGSIGTQWANGTSVINAGTVYYRGVVFG